MQKQRFTYKDTPKGIRKTDEKTGKVTYWYPSKKKNKKK